MLSALLLPGSYGQLSSSFWTSKAGYTLVSDFAENILVVRKMETSDQFFHRMQICLFGTVCTLPNSLDERKKETVSHLLTSDYK